MPPVDRAAIAWHHVVSDFWTADDPTAFRGSVELSGHRFQVRDPEGSAIGVFPTLTEAQARLEQYVLAGGAPEALRRRLPDDVLLPIVASATGLIAFAFAASAALLLALES
jgi:hypothetical protein